MNVLWSVKKKSTTILIVALLVFTLSACKNTAAGNTSSSSTNEISYTASPEQSAPETENYIMDIKVTDEGVPNTESTDSSDVGLDENNMINIKETIESPIVKQTTETETKAFEEDKTPSTATTAPPSMVQNTPIESKPTVTANVQIESKPTKSPAPPANTQVDSEPPSPDPSTSKAPAPSESSVPDAEKQNSSTEEATDPPIEDQHTETKIKTMPTISIQIGSKNFTATLHDNDSAQALLAQLPLTLDMSELNGNEKYYYLPVKLPTANEQVGNIRTGDLMLYGSDCLVLFYEDFSTSYSYTRLGYIADAASLVEVLGSGNVEVILSPNN